MEHLEQLVQDLFDKTRNCDPDIIRSLYEAEHAIELDYRGRYLFELLQNARDAALTAGVKARLKLIIEQNQLVVANNGSEFSNEGYRSICRIGLSSKKMNTALIGNKGMGFKSVLEITSKPQITTSAGTVYFDQHMAHRKIGDTELEPQELPLMFFPLYSPKTIRDYTEVDTYSTVIKLPYLPGVSADNVKREIQLLRSTIFPLLGNFEQLEIVDSTTGKTIQYNIEFPTPQYCLINKTGETSYKLRLFEHRFFIPLEMIAQFSEDEQELVKPDTPIDIRVAIRVDKDGRFVPLDLTSLYLFYPLEENSGFRFIIHSQFVVTPNRKNLLDKSLLNKIILEELVNFLSGYFLEQISKEFPDQVTDIMLFSEMTQGVLSRYGFFKALQQSLRTKPIIWNSVAGRHLSTSEFFLLSTVHSHVFKEPKMGDRYLVYIPNQATCNWLVNSMGAQWLPNHYVTSHIEEYCRQQLDSRKLNFFSNLYAFIKQQKLSLKGKKILLSQHGLLLDQNSEVYYGGQRTDLSIPEQLRSTFTFLHDDVKLVDVRGSEPYTGVIEYNTERLISKAIKLFTEQPQARPALLLLFRNLFSITDLPKRLMDELVLPVAKQQEWTQPFFSALYFDNDFIKQTFPSAKFVDFDLLLSMDDNRDKWIFFLRKCNVWSVPALFVRPNSIITDPKHLNLLNRPGTTDTVELENDIVLDIPAQPTGDFQQQVLSNQTLYNGTVNRFNNTWPLAKRGVKQEVFKCSSFYYSLSEVKWIYPNLKSNNAYRPSELFGLTPSDEGQQGVKAIQRYHPIVFLPDNDIDFLMRFGLTSLRKLDVYSALHLFKLAKENCNGEPPQETDFSSAWNKLYGFVFEFWRKATDSEKNNLIEGVKKVSLLAEAPRATTKKWIWMNGEDILYIDDKPLYDYIPDHIELPPQFTKRDRNEIGMVLQRVGIVLSRRIVTDLVTPDITRSVPFIEFWHWTRFVLPLLENAIGNNLDETQVDLIRRAKVAEVKGLATAIKVSFGKEEQYEQRIPYYLLKSTDGDTLLINQDGLTPAQLAQAANEFLNEILDADTNILLQILELSKSRDSVDATRILDSLNIDTTRVLEINELFNSRPSTIRLAFWNAVANIFDLNYISSEDELSRLQSTLALKGFSFDSTYDLNQKWTPEIANTIAKALRSAEKDPVLLTPLLNGIIDLKKISQDHFYALLLERKKLFVSSLYQFLCTQDIFHQKQFLSYIQRYKELYREFDAIDLFADEEQMLLKRINSILSSFSNDGSFNYVKEGEGMDEIKHYNSCLLVLRERIIEIGVDSKYLPEFLGNIDTQSLLCFDVSLVTSLYSEFLTSRPEDRDGTEPPPSQGEQPPANDKPVVPATIKRPSATGSTGGPGGKKTTSAGFPTSPKRPNQQTLDKIGFAGELYVYQKLKERYSNVEWLSVNAEKAGYIVRGDDNIGYDMKYLDYDGSVRYVEVKATSGQSKRFQISAPEVATGIQYPPYYKIIFVIHALDSLRTTAFDLGFVFKDCLTLGDFVNSNLFQVEASEYTITFEEDVSTQITNANT